MEWAIIPVVVLALLCPLMMIGMIVSGWIFARRATGHTEHQAGGHSGHGHGMMCMMHGLFGKGHEQHQPSVSVDELKAERQRLDELIARAEQKPEAELVSAGHHKTAG